MSIILSLGHTPHTGLQLVEETSTYGDKEANRKPAKAGSAATTLQRAAALERQAKAAHDAGLPAEAMVKRAEARSLRLEVTAEKTAMAAAFRKAVAAHPCALLRCAACTSIAVV